MRIDFFEKEVQSARDRFNQTFGKLELCDLKLRQATILAVCSLGVIARRINNTVNKERQRGKIKQFMKTRKVLINTFNRVETYQKERREDGNPDGNSRSRTTVRSRIAR